MSTATPDNENSAAGSEATAATTFQLTATNQSSARAEGYFNVYPSLLTDPPANAQTPLALVSDETAKGKATTMTWQGGSAALALFAMATGTTPAAAPRTSVVLGTTVAVDWANGAFTLSPAAGDLADSIVILFTPSVPTETSIGLVVGPGAILVRRAAGESTLTLTPDLSPTATVEFGTAFQFPAGDFSDVSPSQGITFKLAGSSAAPVGNASIEVGSDNLIIQNG